MPRSPTDTGWLLSRQGVAADSAGRFVALDLGKQPHRENHEQSEEGNDVLDAIVPQHMLEIKSNRRHHNDKQRKAELDFYRHCLSSQTDHDIVVAHAGPPTFARAARASIWMPTNTISPALPSRSGSGHASKSPGANSTTRPPTTISVLHLSSA